MITAQDPKTQKLFFYQFPQNINAISSQFSKGKKIHAIIQGDIIVSLRMQKNTKKIFHPEQKTDYFWIPWGIFLGGMLSLGGVWRMRKKI